MNDAWIINLKETPKSTWRERISDSGDQLRRFQREYNMRKSKQLEILESQYQDSKKLWDARDEQLKSAPSFYNFNMIKRRKRRMFNEDEVNFIEETVVKDLNAVSIKVEQMINEMTSLGKRLSDLRVVQSKLMSIKQAIEESKEEDSCCRGAC